MMSLYVVMINDVAELHVTLDLTNTLNLSLHTVHAKHQCFQVIEIVRITANR